MANRLKKSSQKSESVDISKLSKSYNLSKIEEDPKEIDDEESVHHRRGTVKMTPKSRPSLPPILQESQPGRFEFFQDFLMKIKEAPAIYRLFTDEAAKKSIISKLKPETTLLLHLIRPKYLSNICSPRSIQLPIETSVNSTSISIQEEISHTPASRSIITETRSIENTRRQSVKDLPALTPVVSSKNPAKLPVLDKSSSTLFEKFKKIAGAIDSNHKDYKLTYDNYKEFLLLRYPNEMIDLMLKWLYHGLSVNFEGWVQDMQKFINLSSEKHCRLTFELYDFNKDRYICTGDAFHAISIQNATIFDQDIVKIRQAFLLKTNNELQGSRLSTRKKKSKNKAFMSAEDELKFKVPATHSSKPEALTLDDFMKIQFSLNKPHLIHDMIKYLTDVDLNEWNIDSAKSQKRKKSEDIIEEMVYNYDFREKMLNDPKIGYYKELESAMLKYSPASNNLLLEKYNQMSSPGPNKTKEISLLALTEQWPKYFGVDNKYISQSFYNLLSGPKYLNISKIIYLNCLTALFNVSFTKEETQNLFAFSIYDRNKDGLITCEELNKFFESLIEGSLIYKECLM